ncbi:MAG: ribosome maturation factor RimM [Terriglobia bacterium]
MKGPTKTEEWLAVACIARPQGRRGEVASEILTDFPDRLFRLKRVFLESPGGPPEPFRVEEAWPHKGRAVWKFAGVDSIDEAERLRGRHILIPKSERTPLRAHQHYVGDLQGCRVLAAQNGALNEIGTVTGVEPTGGVDLLQVKTARGEVLIPLAQEICTRIDTQAKVIVIDPPEDLLELNRQT